MGLAISRSIIESHGGRLWATPTTDGRNLSVNPAYRGDSVIALGRLRASDRRSDCNRKNRDRRDVF